MTSQHDHSRHRHDHAAVDEDPRCDGEEETHGVAYEEEASAKPFGVVIGATFLVNIATLSGLILVMGSSIFRVYLKAKGGAPSSLAREDGKGARLFDIIIYSFAVGALLATAVFLVLPEALELIKGGHESHSAEDVHRRLLRFLQEGTDSEQNEKSESVAAAQFGCAFLGGFLLPLLFAILFHVDDMDDLLVNRVVETVVETADSGVVVSPEATMRTTTTLTDEEHAAISGSKQEEVAIVKPVYNKTLIASIILGDSLHNFADGMFIAASFVGCDLALTFTIVAVTLVHEIAQEIGDFILLTRHGGLSVIRALILNFLSGMSVVLGGIVFLAAKPSNESAGIILAMAAGVYAGGGEGGGRWDNCGFDSSTWQIGSNGDDRIVACKHLLAAMIMPHVLPWSGPDRDAVEKVDVEVIDDREFASLIARASIG
ncbi:hypothetical protein ACHAXA_002683 [Cyclostephanos tholiformis]|uniref:Uncharacterized protein n=1 Tax=Cyclostephanos tholiformis TaxID=382380 RepID=A0ABD3S041_9STRA